MCITVLTTARQLQLSWSRSFQCTASHHIYLKLVLTLSHHSCRSIPNKLYISYQLNAQISLFISFYSPLHVSSSIMLILRRSNCMYTAYGIITLYKWPWWSYITQVEREQRNLCIKLVTGIKFIPWCTVRRTLNIPNGLFPSGFPQKALNASLVSPARTTCPAIIDNALKYCVYIVQSFLISRQVTRVATAAV